MSLSSSVIVAAVEVGTWLLERFSYSVAIVSAKSTNVSCFERYFFHFRCTP